MIIQVDGRWKSVRTPDENQGQLKKLYEGLKPEEREVFHEILKQYGKGQVQDVIKTAGNLDWDPKIGAPVPIRDWLDSEYYLGETSKSIYPVYKEDIAEIFDGGYSEIILTGSTRSGKSYTVTVCALRMLYELYCLKDPQRSLGLGAGEPIHFVPISYKKEAVKRVFFEKLISMLYLSPFFKNKFEETQDEIRFREKNIYVVPGSTSDTGALGLNVFFAGLDECLTGDTQVLTTKGYITINDLMRTQTSPELVSLNLETGELEVSQGFLKKASFTDTYEVLLDNGCKVEATSEHPFLVETNDSHEFVYLRNLNSGDKVVTFDPGKSFQTELLQRQKIPFRNVNGTYPVARVVSIRKGERTQTFDIMSLPHGNLIANGMLVHNTNFMGKSSKAGVSASGEQYDKAQMIYNALSRRIRATYSSGVQGRLFLMSSKKGTLDFTERKIKESVNDSKVFVRDYCPWNTRPHLFANQKWHRISVPEKGGAPRILPDEAPDPPNSRVIKFPEEFNDDFKRDPIGSLRDIAGISVDAADSFFTDRVAVDEMMKHERQHMFNLRVWDTEALLTIEWDKFTMKNARGEPVMLCCPDSPRHVHIDFSRNKCATGVCISHRAADDEIVRQSEEGNKKLELAPFVHCDSILKIMPPQGGVVDHESVRNLIYDLTKGGVPIRSISMDQWSYTPNEQLLKSAGYKVSLISVTRSLDPYLNLRTMVYEKRIESPVYEFLRKELYELELTKNGKVDHPPSGEKDTADSLCGAAYHLIEHGNPHKPVLPSRGFKGTQEKKGPIYSGGDFIWPDEAKPNDDGGSLWIV